MSARAAHARVSSVNLAMEERIVLNVGGQHFVTLKSTLKNVPNTRLSQLDETDPSYDASLGEYYFDRSPQYFSYILDFYRTGTMHFSHCLCGPAVKVELEYWGLDENCISPCCWKAYTGFEDEKQTFSELDNSLQFKVNTNLDHAHKVKSVGTKVLEPEKYTWFQTFRHKLWQFLDKPHSSKGAQVWAIVMFLLILISIAEVAMETHPIFREQRENSSEITAHLNNGTSEKLMMYYETEPHSSLLMVDGICVIIFSVELGLRIIACPSKIKFMKSFYNIIDIFCVVPFLITFIIGLIDSTFWLHKQFAVVLGYLGLTCVLRVFRLFKLARHYRSFRLLVLAVKSSVRELLLLFLLIFMGMLIFSSLIYFAEFQTDGQFTNIPIGFWWSIITMTTVGYGDFAPVSLWGFMVGGLCAVSGTLITGLPIPIIASNFNRYYASARFAAKLSSRKQPSTQWISLDQRTQKIYARDTGRRNGISLSASNLVQLHIDSELRNMLTPSTPNRERPRSSIEIDSPSKHLRRGKTRQVPTLLINDKNDINNSTLSVNATVGHGYQGELSSRSSIHTHCSSHSQTDLINCAQVSA